MDVLFPFLTRHHWLAPIRRPLVAPVFRNQRLSPELKSNYPSRWRQTLALQPHVAAVVSGLEAGELNVDMDPTQVMVDAALLQDMGADVCYGKPQTSWQTWLPLMRTTDVEPLNMMDTTLQKDALAAMKMKTPTADAIHPSFVKTVTTQQPTASDVQYQHIDIEV